MQNPFDFEFDGEESRVPLKQLEDVLTRHLANVDGKVAIVTGSYIVAYDKEQQKLVPLIPTEHPEGTYCHRLALHHSGDFPAKTFELGLKLLAGRSNTGKIVVLVNDHQLFKLHDEQLVPDDQADLIAAGELRQGYFHDTEAIPRTFIRQMSERQSDPDQVLFSLDRKRSNPTDLLPKRSLLISEKFLMNRFEDHTRHRLEAIDGFISTPVPHGPSRIRYCSVTDTCNHQVVFTDDGCGCTEIVLELGLLLAKAEFSHLLMIVPNECHMAVNGSAQATMRGLRGKDSPAFLCLSKLTSITVVSGLGWWLTKGPPTNEACIWHYE